MVDILCTLTFAVRDDISFDNPTDFDGIDFTQLGEEDVDDSFSLPDEVSQSLTPPVACVPRVNFSTSVLAVTVDSLFVNMLYVVGACFYSQTPCHSQDRIFASFSMGGS